MPSYSVNPWAMLPFAALLLAIALMPLIARAWWEHHYPKVALFLSCTTLAYYLAGLREFHRPLEMVHEYISFLTLIASLFIVAGGIHIRVKGESKPWVNVLVLAIGGILANIIGTTGASMLLIRPFLRVNKYRLTTYHVIFFIFIVSNIGGSLTPIGDPPLYLGYLKGVPFFWTMQALFWKWLVGMGWLLVIFYIIDLRNFLRAPPDVRERETAHETWTFDGLHNLLWLGLILIALFIRQPIFAREALMATAAFLSWFSTKKPIYEANEFSWAPIREVAILFAGIFITMMAALDWLEMHARLIGMTSPGGFYWACGLLSSVLDNAPTYLTFLSASIGLFVDPSTVEGVRHLAANPGSAIPGTPTPEVWNAFQAIQQCHPESLNGTPLAPSQIEICYLIGNHAKHIAAISISAVFFGACTYIGNGPNFMVKSIAELQGAKMPSFFGYILKFTLPILLPLLILVWFIFFRTP